jgi:PAS domain S-box-containing protein
LVTLALADTNAMTAKHTRFGVVSAVYGRTYRMPLVMDDHKPFGFGRFIQAISGGFEQSARDENCQMAKACTNGDSGRSRRVLVVINSWDPAESWHDLVSLEGYDVEVATGVQDGRGKLADFAAAVALVDARLPASYGIGPIQSLKQLRPGLQCIVMTDVPPHTLDKTLRQDAYDYLDKPIHPDNLLATLERCFGHIELEARNYEMEAALRKAHDKLEERAEHTSTLEAELANFKDTTELQQAQNSLEEREAELKLTIQIAKLGLWHYDNAKDEYLSVSDEYAQIFGYTAEEFMEQFKTLEDDMSLVHPEDRARVEDEYNKTPEEGNSSETIDIDYRGLHRDGSVRHLREIIHLSYDDSGRLAEERGTLQNLTEFKEAQLEAERANRAKSEFLSRMSHELRTPMNAVLGFGRLLKSNASLTEKHQGFLDHILDSGEHLLSLIDEVLDMSKVESGRVELSLETVEPADVLGQCMVLIEPMAVHHRVTTENLVTESVAPAVIADRTRLKQVLLNLLSNGVKYNCDNGRVTVSGREVEGGLRISVTDTGLGLTEESIANVFEPFARLKAEQNAIEGTGIGLAITKRLVELMGGQLGVQSTPGEGSTFWVELPLASARSVGRVEVEEARAEINSTLKGRILLAEDNLLNQVLAQAVLEKHDLEVDVVENGHEVLEACLAQSYDLVLMDCQMPHMDGLEATAEIRRREIAAGTKTLIPIIALTANAMSGDRERCLAAGMSDFLSKPFTAAEIFELLARWLPAVNTPPGKEPEQKTKPENLTPRPL